MTTFRFLPLTNGQYTIVDSADYGSLSKFTWYAHKVGSLVYVYTSPRKSRKHVHLHRMLMNPPDGMEVDHINHDTLDNRRSNLRICTRSQNNMNHRKRSDNVSGYKGVSYKTSHKKWRAAICVGGKSHHIGYYSTPEEAHAARLEVIQKFHKDFAYDPG